MNDPDRLEHSENQRKNKVAPANVAHDGELPKIAGPLVAGEEVEPGPQRPAPARPGPNVLRGATHQAWARYARAFSEARRGPSEHSIQELQSAIYGLLSLVELLKKVEVVNKSGGLRTSLMDQLEIARRLRTVQQRLHGSEALVADFPQLDAFRETQFNAQSQAVQGTLRALGRIKLASIEKRYHRIDVGLETGRIGSEWRATIVRIVQKLFRRLIKSTLKLDAGQPETAEIFRGAFYDYCNVSLVLEGHAVSGGLEARLAFRFADSALKGLAEVNAVIEGLKMEQTRPDDSGRLTPVLENLGRKREIALHNLVDAASRLVDYPPDFELGLADETLDTAKSGDRALFFLRHAEAVSGGTPGFENDRDRTLTPQGIRLTRKAAAGLRSLGIGFDRILTSPLVRAKETARIVASGTRYAGEIVETETLSPGSDPSSSFYILNEIFESVGKVLIVGHEPELGSLVSILTAGDLSFSLKFKKGAICKISIADKVAPAAGSFDWLLTSKLLAKVN